MGVIQQATLVLTICYFKTKKCPEHSLPCLGSVVVLSSEARKLLLSMTLAVIGATNEESAHAGMPSSMSNAKKKEVSTAKNFKINSVVSTLKRL